MSSQTLPVFEISPAALQAAAQRIRKKQLLKADLQHLVGLIQELDGVVGNDPYWIRHLLPDARTDSKKAPSAVRKKTLKIVGDIEISSDFFRDAWDQGSEFYTFRLRSREDKREPLRLIVKKIDDKLVVVDFMPRGDNYDRNCLNRCCSAANSHSI